ncbi:MAG: hypothetical protein U0136_16575 [Bdellovibrionota bacterium]
MLNKNLRASFKTNLPLALCIAAGIAFIAFGSAESAYAFDDSKFGVICGRTIGYIEGGFGALMSAIAGIGAIIASASGGFRMAWALVVVSIGAFILHEYVDIFFSGLCQ